jgi:archaellum biogenesis ATPase FlaH
LEDNQPFNIWDIPDIPDAKPERKQRQPGEPDGDGTLAKLYQKHPEGGGPYGGRDNALTAYVGYLRSTRIDYHGGLSAAKAFNHEWLEPPLQDWEVGEKVGRAWADWDAGVRELYTQQMAASELMADKLKLLEAKEEPELEIWDWWRFKQEGMNCPQQRWIAENMLIYQGLHYIAAASGHGKSWLGIDLAIACAAGRPWCHFIPTEAVNVLYINEEIVLEKFWARFYKMHDTDLPNLHIIQKKMTKVDKDAHINRLVKYIKEHSIQLVVIDTFVRIHSMDENDNSAVAKLYDRFQELIDAGAAVVILHHNKKVTPGTVMSQDVMRGASDLAAQADLVLTVLHDIDEKTYDVRTVKHRHIGEDEWVNFIYKIRNNEDGSIDLEQVATPGAETEILDRVVQYVADNPGKTKSGIADGVRKNRNSVWDTVDDAMELQLIECRGKRYYKR